MTETTKQFIPTQSAIASAMGKRREHPVLRFLLFSACLSLIPTSLQFVLLKTANVRVDTQILLGDGQMFLVAAGVLMSAMGELAGSEANTHHPGDCLWLSATLVAISTFAVGWYGIVAGLGQIQSQHLNRGLVANASAVCFVMSVLLGTLTCHLARRR